MKSLLLRTLMIGVVAVVAVALAIIFLITKVVFTIVGAIAFPSACVYAFAKALTNRRVGLIKLEEFSRNALCWFALPPLLFTEIFECLIEAATKEEPYGKPQEEE